MCDAEVLEVGDFFDDPGESAWMFDAGLGVPGEAPDVHLVDHHIPGSDDQWLIILPVVFVIRRYDEPAHGRIAVVARLTGPGTVPKAGVRRLGPTGPAAVFRDQS